MDINFEDGVSWLARIRLDDPLLPPKPIQTYITLCEVATLKFLERTEVPAPKVFHYAMESTENQAGVMFVLMEKLEGKPLDWNKATATQRTKVMKQLADTFMELAKHPFESSGSLCHTDARKSTVGAFAQVSLFESPGTSLGPFDTVNTSLTEMIQLQMKLISNGELSSLAVDNYLSHCWRLENIPGIPSSSDDGCFYLKHFEDKGDHILIDNDYNITGIIDWEFASTEPKGLAFSSPCMLWPVTDFYGGNNDLAPEELEFAAILEQLGRKDLAETVRTGRRMQRLTFFNGGGVATDQDEFVALFQGLRAAMAEEGEGRPGSYQSWRAEALEKYADDVALQELLQRRSLKRNVQS